MALKMETKTIHKIDSRDLDEFINSTYGVDYEFVDEHEANNYSSYEVEAPNVSMMWEGTEEKIKSGNFTNVSIHQIFNQLHKDGHIEEGKYLIDVSW